MNRHKLTAPRDCPKCGFEGVFIGPRYREMLSAIELCGVMAWECQVCGFVKETAPLDEEVREEE